MAERWGVIVGIDRMLDPTWPAVPYAENGAKAVAEILHKAGIVDRSRQILLIGSQATRAVVESRLRRVKKSLKNGDSIVLYWAGLAAHRAGAGWLGCWDTLPDDPTETALPWATLVSLLSGPRVESLTLLLDVVGAGLPTSLSPGLAPAELALDDSPTTTALLARQGDEPWLAPAELGMSIWTHLLNEALSGRREKARSSAGDLTPASLQRFLDDEHGRLVRRYFPEDEPPSPTLQGEQNAGAILLPGSAFSAAGDGSTLGAERLARVVFRAERTTRVKDLTDWRKSFDMPERATASAKKFVARIAQADLRVDLDEVFGAARQQRQYKRKDLDLKVGSDGVGYVRTPDFEYTVTASLDEDDPTQVRWQQEVGQVRDTDLIRGPDFAAIFGSRFDQLVFHLSSPFDLASFVDHLEENPSTGVRVSLASDGESCDVLLAGIPGRIRVTRHTVTVLGRTHDATGLLDHFLQFLDRFETGGSHWPMLSG